MAEIKAEEQEDLRRWDERVAVGTPHHKELFCAMLLDSYDPYRPAIIPWPTLSEEARQRLAGLPFWDMAIETEENASRRMQAFADSTADARLRQALELNAFEERRHKEMLGHMMRFYGITLNKEIAPAPIGDPRWAFLRTGYGECFDSFFAFGLFEMARRAAFFPAELVAVFEPVIQEEARHNLFFVNWAAYASANFGWPGRTGFAAQRLAALAVQIANRAKTAKGGASENFTASDAKSLGGDFDLRSFLQLCLDEHDRRMAPYDARLLRPRFMPAVARLAIRLLPSSAGQG